MEQLKSSTIQQDHSHLLHENGVLNGKRTKLPNVITMKNDMFNGFITVTTYGKAFANIFHFGVAKDIKGLFLC